MVDADGLAEHRGEVSVLDVRRDGDARLFDGSMHAWTQDDSRPVANPAQP